MNVSGSFSAVRKDFIRKNCFSTLIKNGFCQNGIYRSGKYRLALKNPAIANLVPLNFWHGFRSAFSVEYIKHMHLTRFPVPLFAGYRISLSKSMLKRYLGLMEFPIQVRGLMIHVWEMGTPPLRPRLPLLNNRKQK